jgi:peroxiredoxin
MPAEGGCLGDGLVGRPMPAVVLSRSHRLPLDLSEYARGFQLVIYLFPGCGSSPGDGRGSPVVDAVQHRAFRDHHDDFLVRECRVIGVSSQSERVQQASAVRERLSHTLVSDPGLQLARELELPTFTADGARWYRRLMLVASGGVIEKVFYPVPSAAHSAAQVLAWIKIHGQTSTAEHAEIGEALNLTKAKAHKTLSVCPSSGGVK